jgi:hypothetical protein
MIYRWLRGFVFLAAAASLGGCDRSEPKLDLDDLTSAESRYVEHFVVLERARAVALVDPERGEALLDSLAAAWGETTMTRLAADLPTDPLRAAAVHDLLRRVLAAEQDSLLHAPRADRLSAPLPRPLPLSPAASGD